MADPPGPLIASGRAADVYALGGGRVLRRYRTDHDVSVEAEVMRHVAAHGYPVPEVHDADGRDLVMDRVQGPSMVDRVGRRPWELWRHGRALADLHRRLADLPVPDLPLDELPHDGAPVLVHGDLHPLNVLLGADGPVVIDWTNAHVGPSGADTAGAWCLIGAAEAPASGRAAALVLGAARHRFLAAFLAAADREAARRALPLVADLRQLDPNLSAGERDRIRALAAAEAA